MTQTSPPGRRTLADLSLYDRSIAFLMVSFLFSCYLLTYTGVIQSSDGLAMFATAESMVRRGEIDINQLLWMGVQQGSWGPDGELYSRKGAGMTWLVLPLVWLAQRWHAIGLVQAALLLNPLLTAWTGGLVYRATIRLGWSRFVAVVTALAYGLATLAWPYTQTFFSDPVAAWGLFGALYGLLAYAQSMRKRYLFLGGVAWGLAYLARSVNLIALPVYGLALAAILYQRRWATGMEQADGGNRSPFTFHTLRATQRFLSALPSLLSQHLREWISFALPILLAGLASLWWNWLRYGSPWETGYLEAESFSADWLFGVTGLLFGPARGILWYNPVLFLVPLGVGWFWRQSRPLWGIILGVSLCYLLLYGKWFMWHGGYSWGPRFLVPTLPFLMLLTAPVWHGIYERGYWGAGGKWLVTVLLLLSLGVQWLGLLIPFHLVQDWLAAEVQPLFAPETFTQLRYSPLLLQWRFLMRANLHFAWWRVGIEGPDWLAFGLVMGAVLVGAWLIARQIQSAEEGGELLPNWIYGVALLLVSLVVLMRYQVPLSGVANAAVAQAIETREEAGDAILHLRPLETQRLANVYHGRLPVYGLLPVEHLEGEAQRWLMTLAQQYRRLWVLPAFGLPESSGWERSLRNDAFLLLDDTMEADGRRLALYAFPHAQPLTETGVGVRFGEPAWARLNGYGYTEQTEPGGELLVTLEWESLRPVTENYQVFVHLLNERGEKLAQRDGQPVHWLRPTSTWQPGEQILDRYALVLDPALPPGYYHIAVGLYDPASGVRQPASAGSGAAIELGPIRVVPQPDG